MIQKNAIMAKTLEIFTSEKNEARYQNAPRQTVGKPKWGGGKSEFQLIRFQSSKQTLWKTVKNKSFVCDQSLSQKVGVLQERNARAKTQNSDTFQYVTSIHDMHI